jgi:TfoX/Sxy family transcriptional regulator of competence genes
VKWDKATPELLALFDRVLPKDPIVERRKMFGFPCGFVNGNLFVGCHGSSTIMFRLSPEDRQAFLALEGASLFEPMPGRPMKEYVAAPEWMMAHERVLVEWIEKALAFAASMPPKEKKARVPPKSRIARS